MTENWGFYERRTGEDKMRILINRGWEQARPDPVFPELLTITVNLLHLMDKGSDKRQTVRTLERIESMLEAGLTPGGQAIYIGRMNTTNRLEFFYYTTGDLDAERIQKLKTELRDYRIQFYQKPDPEWELYSYLLPNALEEMFIHNAQMVYALLHKGDLIEQPRHVYHWLMFRDAEDRKRMREQATELGYQIEDNQTPEEQPGYPYPLVVSRYDDVKLETVNARVRELHPIVMELGGKYDGWGSVMRLSLLQRCKVSWKRMLGALRRDRQNSAKG